VLYVQLPDGGGSAVSLLELIEGLDRDRYEPVVLFYRRNEYSRRLKDLGVTVLFIEPDSEDTFQASRGPPARREAGGASGAFAGARSWGRDLGSRVAVMLLGRRLPVLRDLRRLVREDWPLAKKVQQLVRRVAPDLVHQNNSPRGCRSTYLGAWLAGIPQVGHIRWLHDYTAVDRWVAGRVHRFIYITEAVRKSCQSLGIPASRGEVIYDSLRHEPPLDGPGRVQLRRELGVDADTRVAVSVGRLTAWKGQDDFLRALAALPKRLAAQGWIVGAADDNWENRTYEAYLRDLAWELGIADRVHFLGFREDAGALMGAADVVVHSSNRPEPFGRVVVEAMVAERPVIATAAGGVLESVNDGRTGLLVPMGDSAAMAEALLDLFMDPKRALEMGRAGRQSVVERFSIERHAAEVQVVYEAVLAANTGA
jgi:glycosyltransferase involved in cell wall biosynthesis